MSARVALAALMIASAAPLAAPGAQISPGPLARPHASLEGALNCAQCHGPKKGAMNASCQSCHKEIAWLLERNRGYHASRDVRANMACGSCHPDHAGRDFALISWPGGSRDRFDHRTSGWALDGAHVRLECEDCHRTEYQSGGSARLLKRTSGAGWLGLETTCASCHAGDDEHRGALRESCSNCHTTRDWKTTTRFTHDSTDYPLTGQHAEVECNACHLARRLPLKKDGQGRSIPIYAPVPAAGCADCHSDPHRGQLSNRCAECHTTKSFVSIERSAFNHSLTKYPLRGRHGRVACADCHGANLTNRQPAFEQCASCHDDPHNGTAVLAGKPADCASCHRVEGFAPSTFTAAQHASAPYRLEGRHAIVVCGKCHTPAPVGDRTSGARIARLRLPFNRCTDCHTDSHDGQLAKRADQGACEGCHVVAGWTPSTYTTADHARLRLGLDGRHAEIPCRACHAANRPGLPAPAAAGSLGHAGVALVLNSARCSDCHVDAHQSRYAAGGAFPVAGECATCHSTSSFRPSLVNQGMHDRFQFTLEGAHRGVPCVACHEELKARSATSTLLLRSRAVMKFPASIAVRTCATCHQNPHGDQFAARTFQCESCHGADAFAPASRFDHERSTAFSLRGAHARVPCARCHVARDVGGVRTTIYRPLSGRCESCHDRRPS